MATLCHLSSFSAYIPIKHYACHRPPSLQLHEPLLQLQTRRPLSPYPGRSFVSASSTKKPRARKKVKSNAELCNDIREFVSMVGLPQDHVPTLKDLSQHGRQDLANIVRRRGYKLIKEILMDSPNVESNMEISLYENRNGTDLCEIESTVSELVEGVPLLEGQDKVVNCVPALKPGTQSWGSVDSSFAEGVPLLEGQDEEVNCVPAINSGIQSWGSVDSSLAEGVPLLERQDEEVNCGDSSTESSLQEKAANFVQNGELDRIEIEDMELLTESYMGHGILSESTTNEGKTCKEMENKMDAQSTAPFEECSSEKDTGSNVTSVSNGSTLKSKQVAPPTAETGLHGNGLLPTEGLKDTGLDVELQACERDNEVEINSLKVSLHRKELELSQLQEQIEKEQCALSILQTKAETEISKAQKLISGKDAELHAAEESLSGLKEVQVEYWSNGDSVEVAGSFNGWDHRIKMDLHPSSSAISSLRSRKSRLWSTVLWLYPGVYEFPFGFSVNCMTTSSSCGKELLLVKTCASSLVLLDVMVSTSLVPVTTQLCTDATLR